MQHNEVTQTIDTKGGLYLAGGLALIVFGGVLVLSSPVVKRYLNQLGISDLIEGALPDLERYLKMRAM